jgi:hypothetical protein
VIIVQQFRDVGMEYFVDDYFSVAKFRKAFGRVFEELGDRSLWAKVDISFHVGAPLGRRKVGRQRKNRMKGCLKLGGSGQKASANECEKAKKLVRGKFRCPNCHELGHRKNSPKYPLNGIKKRQVLIVLLIRATTHLPLYYDISLDCDISHSFMCGVRKQSQERIQLRDGSQRKLNLTMVLLHRLWLRQKILVLLHQLWLRQKILVLLHRHQEFKKESFVS